MAAIGLRIERDAVVWSRLHLRICPVTTWGFECWFNTMANSLIAVVSYCMHCKVCMPLNHGICTSTDYLYCLLAYDMLHSHSMCHFHTQSVSYCKTIMQDHVTQLHQSPMLKLALFSGSHSAFCWHCQ